jgi:hypothetical protein
MLCNINGNFSSDFSSNWCNLRFTCAAIAHIQCSCVTCPYRESVTELVRGNNHLSSRATQCGKLMKLCLTWPWPGDSRNPQIFRSDKTRLENNRTDPLTCRSFDVKPGRKSLRILCHVFIRKIYGLVLTDSSRTTGLILWRHTKNTMQPGLPVFRVLTVMRTDKQSYLTCCSWLSWKNDVFARILDDTYKLWCTPIKNTRSHRQNWCFWFLTMYLELYFHVWNFIFITSVNTWSESFIHLVRCLFPPTKMLSSSISDCIAFCEVEGPASCHSEDCTDLSG